MALTSGFYNAMNVGGEYDRKYNADDYKNVFAAFIKDGVRRSGADDFRVSASGLAITVGPGYAVCGGRWVRLDTNHALTTVAPPVGDYSRIDAVVLRVNANENTRAASLVYRVGTPSASPQAPTKDTSTNITELILAHVRVAPGATRVTITDTRPNANLCGWITTPVGYDDYFASLDSRFDTWFQETKNTLASVTLFKQYKWRTVLSGQASSVIFSIPQYSGGGTDIIQVYVNGLLEIEDIDYTLSGDTINFITAGGGSGLKVAGTEVVVLCYKSIDGTGLGSVADEITFLNRALDEGFLGAKNSEDLHFALMWANHDWVDIHPAQRSFVNGINTLYKGGISEPINCYRFMHNTDNSYMRDGQLKCNNICTQKEAFTRDNRISRR